MDPGDELPPAARTIEAKEVSRQRAGLWDHAFTSEGKREPPVARLQVRIKPTTMARLKLFADAVENGFPSLDEMVDLALHEYLGKTAW